MDRGPVLRGLRGRRLHRLPQPLSPSGSSCISPIVAVCPETDRERWDRKYSAGQGPAHFRPNPLLIRHRHLLTGGRALDVACGFGGNALYLAAHGYRVDAVDASGIALARARSEAGRRGLDLDLVQADLARWPVPVGRYDLIVVFFYLNRGILPRLAAGLRSKGLLFQANRNWRYLETRPDFDPAYLLERGELPDLAISAGLHVLHHSDEGDSSELIARKPVPLLPTPPS